MVGILLSGEQIDLHGSCDKVEFLCTCALYKHGKKRFQLYRKTLKRTISTQYIASALLLKLRDEIEI